VPPDRRRSGPVTRTATARPTPSPKDTTLARIPQAGRHLVALADAASTTAIAQRTRSEIAKAGAVCADRRARVLRHPELAARLTQPPVGYQSAEQWNGYVPPARVPAGDDGIDGLLNNSPRRAALIDISAEALRRSAPAGGQPC
jgi:hypothetical protein